MSDAESRVEWREWGDGAFEEARQEDKPVLLALTATWCRDCHEMDAETYSEPRIAANVNDRFVPVRVDVDRHPRVRERYNMGGFPSTVFTTPAGDLLTGATYLGPQGMRQVLDSVAEMWASKGADAGRVPRALAGNPTPAGEVTPTIEEHLTGQLGEKFDEDHAGWGDATKFPLPETIEFALKREREQALRTLDAIRDHLYDDVAGGFFRYAGTREWGDVAYEKVLDTNAALTRAFANAYLYTGQEAYREPAAATLGYLTETLWNGTAIGASQGPAGGAEYYAKSAAERAEEADPRIDLTALASGNALAADAFLTLYAYTDDETAREYAERVLNELDGCLVGDDGAVTHYRDGDAVGETGVLADQARVAGAFTTAAMVLGGDSLDIARRVADYTVETLHENGSFRDGPATGPGLLDKPLRPLDDNAAMADALLDLAILTGDAEYRDVAEETIGAFAGAWDRIGVQVASYGSVAARLCRDPLVISVADEPGSDLHRAALRVADHEKVVRPNAASDSAADAGLAGDVSVEAGQAYVNHGEETLVASDPEELMAQVSEATGR